jgi:hypothetical protein
MRGWLPSSVRMERLDGNFGGEGRGVLWCCEYNPLGYLFHLQA